MKVDDLVIKFHGMSNPHSDKLNSWLESLMRHSPSQSACRMHVFKDPHGYLCKLTVHSRVKTFSSQFKHEDLITSVKNVLKDVRNQVAKWKKNRSSMDLTGVISVQELNLHGLRDDDDDEDGSGNPPSNDENNGTFNYKKVA